ncbi:MAG: glutamyl-tRNA reductase [Ferrimicrobium sp.]
MSLIALSLSTSELKEDFDACALSREGTKRITDQLRVLVSANSIDEALILATCARTEVYLCASQFHSSVEEVGAILASELGTFSPMIQLSTRVLYGLGAVRHLYRVVSGLESEILGESEIHAQAKQALRSGREAGIVGPQLGRYVERSFEVAKRVRHETAIGTGNVSVTSATAALATSYSASAERFLGDGSHVSDPRVAIVGTGAIGVEIARVLIDHHAKVTLLSSNRERLLSMERELVGVVGHPTQELGSIIDGLDTLVLATSSDRFLIEPEMLVSGRDLRIIDLCRPRAVNPVVAMIDGVSLIDLDGVNRFVSTQLAERIQAVSAAQAIIEEELTGVAELFRVRDLSPMLASLYERSDAVRAQELARTLSRLGDMTPEVQAEVEQLSRRIVAKLLHRPASTLRERAGSEEFSQFAEDFRRIFGL